MSVVPPSPPEEPPWSVPVAEEQPARVTVAIDFEPRPQVRWTILLRFFLLIPIWFVLFFLAIAVFFVLLVMLKTSLMASVGCALVPLGLVAAYIFGLRQGKPPGYDRDCFEHWFSGVGFGPDVETTGNLRHPLSEKQS